VNESVFYFFILSLFRPLTMKSEKEKMRQLFCENNDHTESNLKLRSMKDELIQSPIMLQETVNRILASCMPSATRKNSFIINDVPTGMHVSTDEQRVASVFGAILNAVITHTENTCIRISAKFYGKVVLLHLKETHRLNSSAFVANFRQIQQLAEKIEGTVSISNHEGEATTIVFSFQNNLSAAA